MKLLIDTHVLLWIVDEPKRVPRHIKSLIISTENDVYVSAVTAWEIAIKTQSGKLKFDRTFLVAFGERVRALEFMPLDITVAHAVAAGALKGRHKDPFDRMLVAQAKCEELELISRDPDLKELGADPLW